MATGYKDDSDVPPLEDLSAILGQIKTLGLYAEDKETANVSEGDSSNVSQLQVINQADITKTGQEEQKGQSTVQTFGGFPRGFLNKKNPKVSQTTAANPNKEIPIISPKDPACNNLRIPEVQEAMKGSSFLQNKDWITEDFLKKIEDQPELLKKLADPKYSQALDHFISNPQEAWISISDNKELQDFIKDLCGILGEHFTAMAEQVDQNKLDVDGAKTSNSTASTADEEKMAQMLSDPETLKVLKDPWISKLVDNLKNNPQEARRMLARSRPEVLPKIKKLVDAGILTFG